MRRAFVLAGVVGAVMLGGCGSSGPLTGKWRGDLSLAPDQIKEKGWALQFKPDNTYTIIIGDAETPMTISGRYQLRGTALTLLGLDQGLGGLMPGALRSSMGMQMRAIDMQIEWHNPDEFFLRGNAAFAGTYTRVKKK